MPESRPVSDDSHARPYPSGLPALFEVVRRLRAPDGCPWDREQTHGSLRPYLLEETYETLEAIDSGDDVKLCEELGDVLLQVAMHAEIARQERRFDAAQVSETAAAKMVSRHPHVFGDVSVADAEEVLRNWERQKAEEAGRAGGDVSILDRVPRALPALAWVLAMQKRAARMGAAPDDVAHDQLTQQLNDFSGASEEDLFVSLGDLLFAIVDAARVRRVNPEDALRAAGERFRSRFAAAEARAREEGRDLASLDADALRETWSPAG